MGDFPRHCSVAICNAFSLALFLLLPNPVVSRVLFARCSTGKLVGAVWQADKLTAATSAVVVIFNVGIFNKDGLRDDFMICRLSLFNSGVKFLINYQQYRQIHHVNNRIWLMTCISVW